MAETTAKKKTQTLVRVRERCFVHNRLWEPGDQFLYQHEILPTDPFVDAREPATQQQAQDASEPPRWTTAGWLNEHMAQDPNAPNA